MPSNGTKLDSLTHKEDDDDEEEEDNDDDGLFIEPDDQSQQVRRFFAYFYFCINVGAVSSIALVPIVRGFAGFGPAFSLSLWFMIIAIIIFASKRNQYHHTIPGEDGTSLSTTMRLCYWLLKHNIWKNYSCIHSFLPCLQPGLQPSTGPIMQRQPNETTNRITEDAGQEKCANEITNRITEDAGEEKCAIVTDSILDEQLVDAAKLLHVLPILCAFPIFWCLYDQQSSVWTLQANRMELHGLQPEQLNVINPVEIMIFIPLFERIVYPTLERCNFDISPLRRVQFGMFLSALSFVTSGLIESWIQHNEKNGLNKISVFWQFPQITLLALGEIFVSVTGLEFSYACSPDRVKALLGALYLLTTAVGNMFSGVLYSTIFANMNRSIVMHLCACGMMINLTAFHFLVRTWQQRNAMDLLPSLQGSEIELNERGL